MKSSSLSGFLRAPVLVALVGGLVATLFWVFVTTEGSAVPQKPHHVPLAVVGPRPAVAQLAAGLQRSGAFRVVDAPTEANAKRLVDSRKADAIINLETRQLQTAQAASTLTPIVLQQIFSSPQSRLHLATSEIKPLQSGDPTPLGLFFLTMSFVLGGIPAGVAFALLMKNRRPSSVADAGAWVGTVAAYSLLQSLLIAVLAEVVLGYEGHQFLIIWGWGALLSAACMGGTAAAIAAFGIAGALITAVPILFFGVPAAPVPAPWNWESGIFRVLGPFDPFGATANGMRDGIFFRSASQAQNVWVLVVWTLIPVLLLAAVGWRSHRRVARTAVAPSMSVPAVQVEPRSVSEVH
jgi:hypothetical protein